MSRTNHGIIDTLIENCEDKFTSGCDQPEEERERERERDRERKRDRERETEKG